MWNPDLYQRFQKERLQPSYDLAARLRGRNVKRILDVGCGSGMSTLAVKEIFPNAEIIGVDLSETMLEKAKQQVSGVTFMQRDCSRDLSDLGTFDLIFSNAFLHWLSDQEGFLRMVKSMLNKGGCLALSIPGFNRMPAAAAIKEAADAFDPDHNYFPEKKKDVWGRSMETYFDMFDRVFPDVDAWMTHYYHQLGSAEDIVNFLRSTALLPYLDCLNELQGEAFLDTVKTVMVSYYPPCESGKVLFPFERYFFLARPDSRD